MASVVWRRVKSAGIHPAFGTGDEECARLMYPVKPGEVQVPTIHNVEGPGFNGMISKHVDAAHLAVADVK
jgi:hypothetical protein